MPRIIVDDNCQSLLPVRGVWHMPESQWWLSLPTEPTKLTFTLKQRIFGPMYSHTGKKLGFVERLLYGWFITDDPYWVRVDEELKQGGI